MQHTGKVLKTSGKTATVLLEKQTECGSCKACGARVNASYKIRAVNTVSAKPGDKVEVNLNSRGEKAAPFLAYVLPLIFGAGGLLIGKALKNELLMFLFFCAMLVLSFAVLRVIDGKLLKKKDAFTEIIQIIDTNKE